MLVLTLSFKCFATPNLTNSPAIKNLTTTNTYTFKELGWDKSLTLNGYKPNYTFYLPIPQYLNAQRLILHLKLAFSPLLTADTR
ncbi:MAG: cellulose biosynthesis cyclic di-GMP-binding regulatory protein BcsB, partial [bacterium]|nr:cellulose biosynthesis cyclic di-GMP-binding regulatory protein BcsB [bacterium]